MALLQQLLLDGAKQRADDTGDLQTLCMLMTREIFKRFAC